MTVKIRESDIKAQCKSYLDIRGIFNFPLVQGLGAYRGAPDRIAHINGVVYIEFKVPTGKLSRWQEDFKAQCEADGITYWVIRSVDELIEKVEEVLR